MRLHQPRLAAATARRRQRSARRAAPAAKPSESVPPPSPSTHPHPAASSAGHHPAKAAIGQQSEFAKRASQIGLSIHKTSLKLQKLAQLAKRTSMFDDPSAGGWGFVDTCGGLTGR
jgi:hypothetical protein